MSTPLMTKSTKKIAICQFHPPEDIVNSPETTGHPTQPFNRVKHFIQQASQHQADLIIFPEYFMTGLMENKLHLACKESQWITQFQHLAIEFRIDIVPGTIVEQEETHPNNTAAFFNSAYYIHKSGKILGKYRKKNLWHSEKYLTPCMNENKVFEALDGIRVGMLICWDLAWPEAFRELMKQDVELIIIPSFWRLDKPSESKMMEYDPKGIHESNLIDSLIISRSLESESCVIFVNCAGKADQGFLGRSAAALPLNGNLIKLDHPNEELGFVHLDFNVLKDAKQVYKISEEFKSKDFF